MKNTLIKFITIASLFAAGTAFANAAVISGYEIKSDTTYGDLEGTFGTDSSANQCTIFIDCYGSYTVSTGTLTLSHLTEVTSTNFASVAVEKGGNTTTKNITVNLSGSNNNANKETRLGGYILCSDSNYVSLTTGDVTIDMTVGNYYMVFGGARHALTTSNQSIYTNGYTSTSQNGKITANISGGNVDNYYAAGMILGTANSTITSTETNITGTATVYSSVGGANIQGSWIDDPYDWENSDDDSNLLFFGSQIKITNGTVTNVSGTASVTILNGAHNFSHITAGYAQAEIDGGVKININGGTITSYVVGASVLNETSSGSSVYDFKSKIAGGVETTVTSGTIKQIYGASYLITRSSATQDMITETINGGVSVNIKGGSVDFISAGGYAEGLGSGIRMDSVATKITAGTVDTIYGAGYAKNGGVISVDGNVSVNVEGGSVGSIYGAGCVLDAGTDSTGTHYSSISVGSVDIAVSGGTVGTICGGSLYAQDTSKFNSQINGNVNITVSGGEVGNIYGSSDDAYGEIVSGGVNITVTGGTITGTEIIGNQSAFVYGTSTQPAVKVVLQGGTFSNLTKLQGDAGYDATGTELHVSTYLNGASTKIDYFDTVYVSGETSYVVGTIGENVGKVIAEADATGTLVFDASTGAVTYNIPTGTPSTDVYTKTAYVPADVALATLTWSAGTIVSKMDNLATKDVEITETDIKIVAAWDFEVSNVNDGVTVEIYVGDAAVSSVADIAVYHGSAGTWTDVTSDESYISGLTYDASTKMVSFTAKQFSGYAVGVSTIPEPSMFGLLAGTFALALAGTRRRRKSR